jgi:uncharacterized protein YdaU (DUF1376 family)
MAQDIQAQPNVNRFSTRKRVPFFKLYGDDFISGCARSGMTPEEVGAYICLLVLEWESQAPLDDDARRIAVACGWDIRTVRRLIGRLVALGKYRREDGELSNERMQLEIAAYVTKAKAKERSAPTSGRIPTEVGEKSGRILPDMNGVLSKKPNEINEGAPKNTLYARVAPTRVRILEAQKIEKESKLASVEQEAWLAGLNGSAYPMLKSIRGWMVGGDEHSAREWLGNTINAFGEEPTKSAFQKISTEILDGKTVARPLQAWATIARRMANEVKAKPEQGKKAALEAQREKMRAEFGWTSEG